MDSKDVLDAYKAGCTMQTLRRQKVDVSLFENFLLSLNMHVDDMFNDLAQWKGVTSVVLEGFQEWLLKQGYALGSIVVRIATLKAYCRLAEYAGVISVDELRRIDKIRGFHHGVNEDRETTRIGIKKENAIPISLEQATQLKRLAGEKLQDQRDALLMCLLLDHGLRISELSNLRVDAINRKEGTLTISKISHGKKKVYVDKLSQDTIQAFELYLQGVAPKELLLCSFHRNDKKVREGMTGRAINERVRSLGERIELMGLAPEDCRRYWEISVRLHSHD